MKIAVALVEPTYPLNVGYTSRIIKNFGYKKLILVNPKFDRSEARKFASHAADVLEDAEECTFDELIDREGYIIATTAISAGRQANLARHAVPPWEIANIVSGRNICLVLGRDTTGLTNEEIARCDLLVRIPASRTYPALNISHAAAIILYEISKSHIKEKASAPRESIDRIVAGFAELVTTSGLQERKAKMTKEALQRILRRAKPTMREASLLIGLPRKIRLALERPELVRVQRLTASPREALRE